MLITYNGNYVGLSRRILHLNVPNTFKGNSFVDKALILTGPECMRDDVKHLCFWWSVKSAHLKLFEYFHESLVYPMFWVIKNQLQFWKRTDWPFNDPKCQAYESQGGVMSARLALCGECLDYLPDLPYKNGLEFWTLVEQERTLDKFVNIVSGFGKRESEHEQRRIIQHFRKWENPYYPNDSLNKHTYNLISAAITIGKPQAGNSRQIYQDHKKFADKVWKPYLYALGLQLKDLQKGVGSIEFKAVRVQGENLIMLMGGRKTKKIYSLPFKNLSNRGRKSIKP